jgi:two-component system, sensor histidine kinase RpfC
MPPITFQGVRGRLSQRTDTEHHQAILRLVIGTAAAVTLMFHWAGIEDRGETHLALIGLTAFYAVAMGIFAHICLGPTISVPRRYLGIVTDVAFVTSTLTLGHDASVQGLVMIYLWIILGNGLRFGQQYLLVALALSLCGFFALWLEVPFWQENSAVFFQVLIGQVAVSLYMRSLVVRMNVAIEREAAANSAKGRFVSRMSHEMRTPLNAIIGAIDLVHSKTLTPPLQEEMLINAQRSAVHLRGLISDVLDFSKIEADKLSLSLEETDLRDLLWSTAKMLRPQFREKNVAIDVHLERGVPTIVYSDALRLRQVFINLIGNALKFTSNGYVRLEAYVVERKGSSTVSIRFAVRDTGIGIPKEKQEKIFESFTQADESVMREFGGTGLGLTITQHLVNMMGGNVTVTSQPGHGSTFSFVLPMRVASDQPGTRPSWAMVGCTPAEAAELSEIFGSWGFSAHPYTNIAALADKDAMKNHAGLVVKSPFRLELLQAAELCQSLRIPLVLTTTNPELVNDPGLVVEPILWPVDRYRLFDALTADTTRPSVEGQNNTADEYREAFSLDTGGIKILVVDDTASNLAIARAVVENMGHQCTTATSAMEALDLYAEEHFDILICDRNMPEMDGVALVREIRYLDAMSASYMQILMLTGDATEDARQEALSAGADAFMTKPIRPVEMQESIARLAEKSVGARLSAPTIELRSRRALVGVVNEEMMQDLAMLKPDDPEFVGRAQRHLINDCYDWLLKISKARSENDIEQIKAAVHAIKGSSGSVGMVCIERVCDRYHALKQQDIDSRAVLFEKELKEAIVLAETYLSSTASLNPGTSIRKS